MRRKNSPDCRALVDDFGAKFCNVEANLQSILDRFILVCKKYYICIYMFSGVLRHAMFWLFSYFCRRHACRTHDDIM